MKASAFAALVLVLCTGLVLCAVLAHADVPRTMSYQGVLRDDDGNTVPDDSYSIEFNIYDVEVGGTSLWTETQSVDVRDGLFNVILGSTTPLDIDFDVQYWLGITIEAESELDPRIKLTSAPYALRAAVADSVKPTAVIDDGDWEVSGSRVWHDGNVGIGTGAVNPSFPLEVWGDSYFHGYADFDGNSYFHGPADFSGASYFHGGAEFYGLTYFLEHVDLYAGLTSVGNLEIANGDLLIDTGKIVTGLISPVSSFAIDHVSAPFLFCDDSSGYVGIKTGSPAYQLDVAGTVNCTGFRLPTGATVGDVLTSDASGNATWETAPAPSPPLESGKFDSNADYALLVDCNDAQLLQNGSITSFRILANVGDSSVCYTYYVDGSLISKATLSPAGYYDFTVPTGSVPYHAEVILSRPWAGGAIARIDIISQNNRCGGIWHSSH